LGGGIGIVYIENDLLEMGNSVSFSEETESFNYPEVIVLENKAYIHTGNGVYSKRGGDENAG
jgi:hypothetical protein